MSLLISKVRREAGDGEEKPGPGRATIAAFSHGGGEETLGEPGMCVLLHATGGRGCIGDGPVRLGSGNASDEASGSCRVFSHSRLNGWRDCWAEEQTQGRFHVGIVQYCSCEFISFAGKKKKHIPENFLNTFSRFF